MIIWRGLSRSYPISWQVVRFRGIFAWQQTTQEHQYYITPTKYLIMAIRDFISSHKHSVYIPSVLAGSVDRASSHYKMRRPGSRSLPSRTNTYVAGHGIPIPSHAGFWNLLKSRCVRAILISLLSNATSFWRIIQTPERP